MSPDKSLTIGRLDIPGEYFLDFLRGEIDGDGSFREYKTKFRCSISSGSKQFLDWLFSKIKKFIDINGGWVRNGNNVYELGFAIRDSLKIARAIYQGDKPKLTRKYKIVEKYLE